MRIALYTSDLTQENQGLMPWRMLLEIGKAACAAGHQAWVLSGRRAPTADRWACDDCPVEEIAKPHANGAPNDLQEVVRREGLDVLFWPVAWWMDRRQEQWLRRAAVPIVWYIPGACYLLHQAVRAVPDLGLRTALPFLIQSLYPKRRLLSKLRSPATNLMITASEFNRSAVCRAGWPAGDVFVVPPGKPAQPLPTNGDEPVIFHAAQRQLAGRPFYLFLGPPTGIRGIRPLLQAFDLLADQRPEVCLVCLFRSDPGADVAAIRRKVESEPYAERIVCVWQSVGPIDLDAFLEACYAVVLPFLLVPSEIPLAVIEAAGYGKPVITTGPGGTADFVRDFGLAVPSGRSKALARAMLRLLDDRLLYAHKCRQAQRAFAAHPTWDQVAQSWLSVAREAVERNTPINLYSLRDF
jgi:glycosyltransferase involved in cell wall biosynthesis